MPTFGCSPPPQPSEEEADERRASERLRQSAREAASARGMDVEMDTTLHNIDTPLQDGEARELTSSGSVSAQVRRREEERAEGKGGGEGEEGGHEEGDGDPGRGGAGDSEWEGDGGDEDGGEGSDDDGVVALVAMRSISRGREVYNTYGEHPNRTLLLDYGALP